MLPIEDGKLWEIVADLEHGGSAAVRCHKYMELSLKKVRDKKLGTRTLCGNNVLYPIP